MRKFGTGAILAGGAAALIFIAGFFNERAPEACSPQPVRSAIIAAPSESPSPRETYFVEEGKMQADALRRTKVQGLLALTSAPGYKRAGDLSLRVPDCTKAEDELETKLQKIKGEIIDMLMEGTEGSRTCSLSVVIPAHEFRGFITALRTMGKIQAERITASKLKPGQAEAGAAGGDPDPRELSLVSIRMADEKIAQTVLESRGILAASFDRSASHFMKGLAVIVELFGLALPFLLAFGALALPVWVGLRLRRARTAALAAE